MASCASKSDPQLRGTLGSGQGIPALESRLRFFTNGDPDQTETVNHAVSVRRVKGESMGRQSECFQIGNTRCGIRSDETWIKGCAAAATHPLSFSS